MWRGEQGNIQVEEAKGVSRRKQSSTCQIWMSKEKKIRHGKIQKYLLDFICESQYVIFKRPFWENF